MLGIAFMIGPILIVLGMHNFDIQAAFMPSEEEMEEIQNNMTSLFDMEGLEEPSIGTPTVAGNTVRLPISFTSPVQLPITIKGFSAALSDGGMTIAQIQMEEPEVEVAAGGSASLTLIGQYTGGIPGNPQMTDLSMSFEMLGVTVEADMGSFMGGP